MFSISKLVAFFLFVLDDNKSILSPEVCLWCKLWLGPHFGHPASVHGDLDMTSIQTLLELGKEIGLEGKDLQDFVKEQ